MLYNDDRRMIDPRDVWEVAFRFRAHSRGIEMVAISNEPSSPQSNC